jgi:hypothetical protein
MEQCDTPVLRKREFQEFFSHKKSMIMDEDVMSNTDDEDEEESEKQ